MNRKEQLEMRRCELAERSFKIGLFTNVEGVCFHCPLWHHKGLNCFTGQCVLALVSFTKGEQWSPRMDSPCFRGAKSHVLPPLGEKVQQRRCKDLLRPRHQCDRRRGFSVSPLCPELCPGQLGLRSLPSGTLHGQRDGRVQKLPAKQHRQGRGPSGRVGLRALRTEHAEEWGNVRTFAPRGGNEQNHSVWMSQWGSEPCSQMG